MRSALELEGKAQRLLLAGAHAEARRAFRDAAVHYRSSWELASPTSYGRLVGLLKAAIIAGDGEPEAQYARAELADARADSPTAAYALAIAALVERDDEDALRRAHSMRQAGGAFERAGDAIAALARHDGEAYSRALQGIVRDFEERSQHVTGVAIADTALMLERLAARRGMRAGVSSPLLPSS
jgi:hypothetical protein